MTFHHLSPIIGNAILIIGYPLQKIDEILCLEGKAYFKDEVTGLNKTFLFEIPKMKITSNLNIVMGEKASPTISVFNVIGLPIKENNQWIVSKMYLLSDDIDNDI